MVHVDLEAMDFGDVGAEAVLKLMRWHARFIASMARRKLSQ
jgi:hypothetical protein